MGNDYFRFKQFTIRHNRCAMKVGTDAVLLGAWGVVNGDWILDIGTGTGIIALMAAQRNSQAKVLGIDIVEDAVEQAKENVKDSPFSNRVRIELQDVMLFRCKQRFNAILCNPPFFTEQTLPPDASRILARNNQAMPFARLISKVDELLSEDGTFSLILPTQSAHEIIALCMNHGLYLKERCIVRTSERKPPRRTMLAFSRTLPNQGVKESYLCLTESDGSRSQAYKQLTSEFYL